MRSSLTRSTFCSNIFRILSLPDCKSSGADILREGSPSPPVMFHMSCVINHMSCDTRHMSHVYIFSSSFWEKVVKLVGGGSVLNRVTQSNFFNKSFPISKKNQGNQTKFVAVASFIPNQVNRKISWFLQKQCFYSISCLVQRGMSNYSYMQWKQRKHPLFFISYISLEAAKNGIYSTHIYNNVSFLTKNLAYGRQSIDRCR